MLWPFLAFPRANGDGTLIFNTNVKQWWFTASHILHVLSRSISPFLTAMTASTRNKKDLQFFQMCLTSIISHTSTTCAER